MSVDLYQVAWEVFSYPISGKGNTLLDLLFLGTIPSNVTEEPTSRRQKTGSVVLKFDGCEGIVRRLVYTHLTSYIILVGMCHR